MALRNCDWSSDVCSSDLTVDAGLVWNRKDIGLMKEFYNIQYKTDLEGFRAFDQKVLDIYKKANPTQRIAEGANITSTLDGMMKNEHVKFLRTYVNPYYHPEKGFVNPDVTPTARMVDPLEVNVDGKRMVIPGLETWATPHTLVSQHEQVVGHKAKWIKGGIHNDPFLHMRNAMFKGSIEERLLERTAGTYKHKLRNSMLKYLGGLKGVSALSEGAVRIDGGLDVLLQRTLTNEEIMKDV